MVALGPEEKAFKSCLVFIFFSYHCKSFSSYTEAFKNIQSSEVPKKLKLVGDSRQVFLQ